VSARIVLGSYMIRYPMGGMISNVLQWLVGFHRLGHDVYFVERAGYENSCFDPVRGRMSDDCSYGMRVIDELLSSFGMGGRWCYADAGGGYHGLSRDRVEEVLRSADLFVDMGTHGSWLEEAAGAGARVLVDGEPGFTQMKLELRRADGEPLPEYDHHYTVGQNVGRAVSSVPDGGREWRTVFHPVLPELFEVDPPPHDGAFTTVMNWQSHHPLVFEGRRYGQKDIEFDRFLSLPRLTEAPLEVAVAGKDVPRDELRRNGWRIRDAHRVTESFDSFRSYIRSSLAEFSVCKNMFVDTASGWFSDRSAAYLASGRPVVLQETGWSRHLPTGEGLFAVGSVDEAAAAIDLVAGAPEVHSRAAREIAGEYLEARKLLGRFLDEVGVG